MSRRHEDNYCDWNYRSHHRRYRRCWDYDDGYDYDRGYRHSY
jgi:hypothetical protein